MKTIFLFFSLISCVFVNGQKWTYSSGNNAFDGAYRTSSVIGNGGSFPYNTPSFIINYFQEQNLLNIYITNAGYAGCNNLMILLKFDNDNETYVFSVTTNAEKDTWFISERSQLNHFELLNRFMNHSFVNARLSSDCGLTDYKFSLTGSSEAINYVAKDWLKKEQTKLMIQQNLEIDEKLRIDSIEHSKELKAIILKQKKDSIISSMKTSFHDARYKVMCTTITKNLYLKKSDVNPFIIIPANTVIIIDTLASQKPYFYKVLFIDDGRKVDLYANMPGIIEVDTSFYRVRDRH